MEICRRCKREINGKPHIVDGIVICMPCKAIKLWEEAIE